MSTVTAPYHIPPVAAVIVKMMRQLETLGLRGEPLPTSRAVAPIRRCPSPLLPQRNVKRGPAVPIPPETELLLGDV